MTRFSRRTEWDLAESSFASTLRQARASGRRLWDLTVSNPTVCGFRYDAEALLPPVTGARAMTYEPDPRGLASARAAVARYYSVHHAEIGIEDLLLTTSTSESYSYLFRLLCDPGDEVLVAQPSYPLFDFLAELDDVCLRPYPVFYDHGWWIDRSELERAIGPKTRAILVVHPNNPTGHWTRPEERAWLQEICVRHNLALVVDEVFLDYPLGANASTSFTTGEHPALTFVLSGLSKICGLPQMKTAWIVALGPEKEKSEALSRLEVIADTFLSVSTPIQLALPQWLDHAGDIQRQILVRAGKNLEVLRSVAAQQPGCVQVLEPEAGWSAILSLPRCGGDPACAGHLLASCGVIVHPGSFYGMSAANRVVVSLIVDSEEFEQGIRRAISEPIIGNPE